MKAKFLLLIILVTGLGVQFVKAQNYSPDWVNDIGGTGDSKASNIVVDKDHNVFVSGYIRGTITFDLSQGGSKKLSALDDADIYLAKYTSTGSCLWAISMGGVALQQPNSMTVDSEGNLIITGQYQGAVNFNPAGSFILTSKSAEDVFLAKYNTNGEFIWALSIGGDGTDRGHSVSTDSNNNVFLSASYNSAIDADPGAGTSMLPSVPSLSCFFAKFSSDGSFQWVRPLGAIPGSNFTAIKVDKNNDVIVVGGFSNLFDFSYTGAPGATFNPSGVIHNYVGKYSNAGVFKWVRYIPGSGTGILAAVKADNNSNIIVSGSFSGNMNADNSSPTNGKLTAKGSSDIVLLKYLPDGSLSWAKNFGNPGSNAKSSYVEVDSKNEIFLASDFSGSVNFDATVPGATVNAVSSGRAISAARFSTSGSFLSAFAVGSGCSSNFAYEIAVHQNSIYLAGSFCSKVDFDPGTCIYEVTARNPTSDSFLAKYSQQSGSNTPVITSFAISQQIAPAIIDNVNKTVVLKVSAQADLSSLVPVITGQYGSISPISGIAQNFTSTFNYTLTGNCMISEWKVTVTKSATVNVAACSGLATVVTGETINPVPDSYGWEMLQGNNWVIAPGVSNQRDYMTTGLTNPGNTNITVILRRKITTQNISSYDSMYDVTIESASVIQLTQPVVTIVETTASTIKFTWSESTNATGYEVSLDNGETFIDPMSIGGSETTYMKDERELTFQKLNVGNHITLIVRALGSTPCATSKNSLPVTGTAGATTSSEILIPNTFTPNGDGNNDILYVIHPGLKTMKWSIYTRWGNKIFETIDSKQGWDGMFQGAILPVGVYVYHFQSTGHDESKVQKSGTITILR